MIHLFAHSLIRSCVHSFSCLFACSLQSAHMLQSPRHANLSLLQRTAGKTHFRRGRVWKLRHAMRIQPSTLRRRPLLSVSSRVNQPPPWLCVQRADWSVQRKEGPGFLRAANPTLRQEHLGTLGECPTC